MFTGRQNRQPYIQIYTRIYQKSIPPKRFFFEVGPGPPVRPLLNIQSRVFRPSPARPLATGAPAPMRSTISRPHTVPGLASVPGPKLSTHGPPALGPTASHRDAGRKIPRVPWCYTQFFFWIINRDFAAGPLLDLRCVNCGAERWGPFRPGSGLGAWAPQPPKFTTRERTRAFGVVGAPPHFVRTPYARMLGPPHELQAYLFGVRWSLSNRPYSCRRALSVCRY